MKTGRIVTIVVASMLIAACRSTKVAQQSDNATTGLTDKALVEQVSEQAASNVSCVAAKMKFSVSVGSKDVSLSGNLRMKRGDVIRLQLMALGLVEAARLEFTKDYVLLMDRINKQYVKAPYDKVDFLRSSGLNFSSLQALFWNELFLPGQDNIGQGDFARFGTATGATPAITYADAKNADMKYHWLVNPQTRRISQTTITHSSQRHGNTQLQWAYNAFGNIGTATLPTDMDATLDTAKRQMKLHIKLSSLSDDSDWETRTKVSSRYEEVDVDDILKRITSL